MKIITTLILLTIAFSSYHSFSQTIYVPNHDVGNSSNANVGIGTGTSPAEKLEVAGNIRLSGAGGYWHSLLLFYRSDGVKFASIGQSNLTTANSTFDIQHFNGNDIRFLNVGVEHLRITEHGKVGIGTATPDAKLTVAGDIHSREVKVTVNAGADFVFDDQYKLKSLDEVETFIKANKHLPEIQSAKEMETDGIELGKMDIKLLQKIEELTLYMIAFKKEMERIKSENEKLKKELCDLKNR